ncbi:MAG: CobW family GTP-binding protein [Chloroflexota bacterium]
MTHVTVPLTIITGFLGAGKTTLLNRILNSDHGLKIAVLVNDFGAVNIDDALIQATSVDGDTISLANGCICCTIRGDLMQAVADLFTVDDPPEYIILETSGVSDPLEVAITFRDVPRMSNLVRIDSIITVVDAEQFPRAERENEYAVLVMNQIGMADIIVLNKTDLVSMDDLTALETRINHIMPRSRVFHTTHAEVPLELLLGVGAYDPANIIERTPADVHVHEQGEHHHHDHEHTDHSTVFDTWSWSTDKPLSLKAVQRAIAQVPASVYRMKGVLYAQDEPDTRVVMHVVGRRAAFSTEVTWPGTPRTEIVAIAAAGGVDADTLTALFEGCLYENAPKNELERLARGVMAWVRGEP